MKANLKRRLFTASVGIPLLILLIVWGRPWQFVAVIVLVTGGALWEYFSLAFPQKGFDCYAGIALGLLMAMGVIISPWSSMPAWFALIVPALALGHVFSGGNWQEKVTRTGWTVLGVIYVGYWVPHWVVLFGFANGRAWVAFVLLVVMMGDTVAYFVGSAIGRRKLAPTISPGKTMEGAVGFVAGSVAAGLSVGRYLLPDLSWIEVAALAMTLSVLGQAGDLFESWIKRQFAAKDSGTLLPGHGGLLDRLDSLIFPVVFTSYYVRFFRP